jgi:hypothetical protein
LWTFLFYGAKTSSPAGLDRGRILFGPKHQPLSETFFPEDASKSLTDFESCKSITPVWEILVFRDASANNPQQIQRGFAVRMALGQRSPAVAEIGII